MNESKYFFNNEAFGMVAIAAVLKHAGRLPISKIVLILPFLSHKETVSYLKGSNSVVRSLEELIAKKGSLFSNFYDRYLYLLPIGLNSLLLLKEMKIISETEEGEYSFMEESGFQFRHSSLGKRSTFVYEASSKLAAILRDKEASELYLHLRVRL
ncbi:three component ABC system middle component [Brevibacillus borstelensis]|uniref:three component ABC system middle component n=1 Tax=Brevibacillus borstelensis TaxID=45462 RepID=UPI002E1F5F96|nr:DUF6521 family protein [Brevibacillus borstelensis]